MSRLESMCEPVSGMTRADDRTEEQKKTHTVIVAMTDRCLSGWGGAAGGTSYAGWACRPEDAARVERWVRNRSDAMRVRIISDPWRPRGPGHTHVYVVNDGHPSLS